MGYSRAISYIREAIQPLSERLEALDHRVGSTLHAPFAGMRDQMHWIASLLVRSDEDILIRNAKNFVSNDMIKLVETEVETLKYQIKLAVSGEPKEDYQKIFKPRELSTQAQESFTEQIRFLQHLYDTLKKNVDAGVSDSSSAMVLMQAAETLRRQFWTITDALAEEVGYKDYESDPSTYKDNKTYMLNHVDQLLTGIPDSLLPSRANLAFPTVTINGNKYGSPTL